MKNTERDARIIQMHEDGEPFTAIAKAAGITPTRARDIVLQHQKRQAIIRTRSSDWRKWKIKEAVELSVRAINSLCNAGYETVADAREAFGKDTRFMRDIGNCGGATLAEINAFLAGGPSFDPSLIVQTDRLRAAEQKIAKALTLLEAADWPQAQELRSLHEALSKEINA